MFYIYCEPLHSWKFFLIGSDRLLNKPMLTTHGSTTTPVWNHCLKERKHGIKMHVKLCTTSRQKHNVTKLQENQRSLPEEKRTRRVRELNLYDSKQIQQLPIWSLCIPSFLWWLNCSVSFPSSMLVSNFNWTEWLAGTREPSQKR